MLRKSKKNKTHPGELSLFGPEHWENSDQEQGGSAAQQPDQSAFAPRDVDESASPSEEEPSDSSAASIHQRIEEMRWAIRYVNLIDLDTARMIAMETSMIVQSNYQPDHLYVLSTLPGERMTGQKVGMLCYASFMRAFPGMADHLNLNYHDIYEAALIP